MSSVKKWLVFGVYFLLVTGFFLYLLFPSDAVKSYVRYRLSALVPGTDFTIANVRPGFPPSLVFTGIDFSYQRQPFATIDRLAFLPGYLSLLKHHVAFHFNGRMYGGKMDGRADIAPGGNRRQLATRLAFTNVRLDQIPAFKNFAKYSISGAAAGNMEYAGPADGSGKGKAEVRLTNCSVNLEPPVFGIPKVTFDLANADIELKNQQLDLKEVTVKGHDLSGNAKGQIFLRNPVADSRIQLNGKITPHPALLKTIGAFFPRQYLREGGIPFRVYGTLKQMNYSLR